MHRIEQQSEPQINGTKKWMMMRTTTTTMMMVKATLARVEKGVMCISLEPHFVSDAWVQPVRPLCFHIHRHLVMRPALLIASPSYTPHTVSRIGNWKSNIEASFHFDHFPWWSDDIWWYNLHSNHAIKKFKRITRSDLKLQGKPRVCRQIVRKTNRTDFGQTVRRQIVRTD